MRFSEFVSKYIVKYAPFPNFTAFFIAGFCFGWICFITGIWLNQYGRTPLVEKAINSTYALVHQSYNSYIKPNTYEAKNFYWLPERYKQKGVVVHQEQKFSEGYTLIVSAHQQGANLIGKSGKVVHQWTYPYQILLAEQGVNIGEEFLYWWQAKVFPNGDLLAIVTVDNRTPAGLALLKLDKNSNLLWQYQAHVHHDFDIDIDADGKGNIYLLEQSIQQSAPEELSFLPEPYLNEWLTIINAQGKLVKKINLYYALASSPYRRALRRISKSVSGDYLHPNSVKVISARQAKAAPYLQENTVLIDLREIDSIMTVDLETESVNWLIQGPWFYQHDPDVLENGNLLVFDNISLNKQSRVIEFDPRQQKVVWEYKGTEQQPLYSTIRGGQQKLPNGNVLIYESNGSRLLEVDTKGELVWEYYSTQRVQDKGSDIQYAPVIMSAHRYQQSELQWLSN